ncbi:uncharacterized protein LOC112268559 isoform X2 [Brachypodium distachyon]|uniref:uncharacterized protein LOC112268559 isoform X2 n=1 Tax=Brachypodium distachyon TaxID=15368 RepID=UPI000D0CDD65|nr:uncharacterized protein LOC112268559 isoform X2 [Brachypodium distachyon]|eukprot:XP_024318319.1 uncharacterized protein LOC112268559 isoform X2 [Brachypodium distachyon]
MASLWSASMEIDGDEDDGGSSGHEESSRVVVVPPAMTAPPTGPPPASNRRRAAASAAMSKPRQKRPRSKGKGRVDEAAGPSTPGQPAAAAAPVEDAQGGTTSESKVGKRKGKSKGNLQMPIVMTTSSHQILKMMAADLLLKKMVLAAAVDATKWFFLHVVCDL